MGTRETLRERTYFYRRRTKSWAAAFIFVGARQFHWHTRRPISFAFFEGEPRVAPFMEWLLALRVYKLEPSRWLVTGLRHVEDCFLSLFLSLSTSFPLSFRSLVSFRFLLRFKARLEKFIDAFPLKKPLVPECFILPRTFPDLISKFPHAFELPLHAPLRAFRREFAMAFQYAQTVSSLIHTLFLYFRC